ncbi:Isoamyl acetate-hydrolyzing esterase [Phaffia rhodozyma]|uniref:Isoamyl acetate-hydrolyzing esterase n=1 Tax=Phaffia rhodozyma TaxID=264483 RepID=A0A0F7SUZ6_PHARH|nr:Isoamyl acetate-hydrolyzing esterase [Phaffia rhodozyma]
MASSIKTAIALGFITLSSLGLSRPVISEALTVNTELWHSDITYSGFSDPVMQDQLTSHPHVAQSSKLPDDLRTSTVSTMELPSSDIPYAILLGDSITDRSTSPEGFTTQLTRRYGGTFSILNRGVGGISTRGVLPIARDLFVPNGTSSSSIKFITLLLGTNDSVGWGESRVPLGEYVQNLDTILNMLSPSVIKLLITPPIPSEVTWNGRTKVQMALYADACRNLGHELEAVGEGVILVDFWQVS